MPLPLIILGAGAAAVASGAVTARQLLKAKGSRKQYETACARAQTLQRQVERKAEEMDRQAEAAGQDKLTAAAYLRGGVDFLNKAAQKPPEFAPQTADPEIRKNIAALAEEADLLRELMLSCGGGADKAKASALHRAVGLFGPRIAKEILEQAAKEPNWRFAAEEPEGEMPHDFPDGEFLKMPKRLNNLGLALVFPLPALLTASVWSVKNARQTADQVQKALKELAETETDLGRQSNALDLVLRQLSINRQQGEGAKTELIRLLNQADPAQRPAVHGVYRGAQDLSRTINAAAITPEQAEILGMTIPGKE